MKFTDLISPFLAWSRAARKSDTIRYPDQDHPGSDRYRGFHRNDLEKCIGCGRCHDICQNQAIDMVPAGDGEPATGDSGLRPLVDYGRCCWCGLCVDVCSTDSLSLSNTYSWPTFNADTCSYVPGRDQKAWDVTSEGYSQENAVLGWAGSSRVEMPVQDPNARVKDFSEVVKGYSDFQAREEAARCIQCGLCVTACPAHMHIPEYLRAIAEGDNAKAVKLFYDNNPLPEMCGKVCTRQCETVCAMGYQGEAIAIRWLKRFAAEAVGSPAEILDEPHRKPSPENGRIAIVGAGPAGLSVAYHLARMGFDAHVFERDQKGGGVAQHAIPRYRLPEEGYERQMEPFHQAGVNFHYGSELNSSAIERLAEEYDALFLAPGLQSSSEFRIPGTDLPGVKHALYFLSGDPEQQGSEIGESVLVIGGGNVAMDTARTCRRLGADVVISYRRRLEDMPADEEEIEEALEEGVDIRTRTIPERIESADGKLRYVYWEAEMVPDPEGGRPKPVKKDDVEHFIKADTVFLAIGQSSDLSFLPDRLLKKLNIEWGRIRVDENRYTGVDSIWAGGDVTPGAGDVITAVADGMRAARAIADELRE